MNKSVLLIYPPQVFLSQSGNNQGDANISMALLYLAGAVRTVCDDIKLLDMNLPTYSLGTLDSVLYNQQPSVVGINCLFSAIFPEVKKIASHIKSIDTRIKVVIGGMHPTIFAEELIDNCPDIDAVVIGEGETAFGRLLQYYWGELTYSELDSVVVRDSNNKTILIPKSKYIECLDDIPRPAYDLVNFNDYARNVSGWYNPNKIDIYPTIVPILTSRSCPNACCFCSMRLVMGNKFRERTPESVFSEIKHLYDGYGVNYFKIMDDNFTFNRERAVKILQMIIDSGIKIGFEFPNGLMIRTLDPKLIELMAKAGCVRAHLAVESGSDYLRNKIMRKNVTKEKIYEVLSSFRVNRIKAEIFLLIGMPEETEQTMLDTIDFISGADIDWYYLMNLIPLPGTAVFEQCRRDGLFVQELNEDEMWTGNFFKHSENDSSSVLKVQYFVKPYELTLERLDELRTELIRVCDEKCADWAKHLKENSGRQ